MNPFIKYIFIGIIAFREKGLYEDWRGEFKEWLLQIIGVARGDKGTVPSKFLAYRNILCFETYCPKPNAVARLNSKYFPPKPLLGKLRYCSKKKKFAARWTLQPPRTKQAGEGLLSTGV